MTQFFDPLKFGFVKLPLQNQSLCFYEYQSGSFVDGVLHAHRLNTYLTQDGSFVTVWHGLFDPAFISEELQSAFARIGDGVVNLHDSYQTQLFQGYIESEEDAQVILKALRFEKMTTSLLHLDDDGRVCCDPL